MEGTTAVAKVIADELALQEGGEKREDLLANAFSVKQEQVLNCMFPSWYSQHKTHTFPSKIIPLPEDFIEFLLEDGLVLPDSAFPPVKRDAADDYTDDDDWYPLKTHKKPSLDEIDEGSSASDEEDDIISQPRSFPHLEAAINEAIDEFGAVFPKLNWSSPKDASWMNLGGTLKCTSHGDVLLLLKSSDFVMHDLNHAFDLCSSAEPDKKLTRPPNFVLVLRRWYDLSHSTEFRCFVSNRNLRAISQRDPTKHFPFLLRLREELESLIATFFELNIQDEFPDVDVVFDVYIEHERKKVWLVDFNPFSPTTDSLLFTWEEIYDLSKRLKGNTLEEGRDAASEATSKLRSEELPVFRIIESEQEVRIKPAVGVPVDVIDVSSASSIERFADLVRQNKLF